jgi:hypothetical protein
MTNIEKYIAQKNGSLETAHWFQITADARLIEISKIKIRILLLLAVE